MEVSPDVLFQRIGVLTVQVDMLAQENAQLKARIAELEAQAAETV